jgi:hypothetical protein
LANASRLGVELEALRGAGLDADEDMGQPAAPQILQHVGADVEARFGLRELLIVDDEFFGGTGAGFERAREFGRRLERQGACAWP